MDPSSTSETKRRIMSFPRSWAGASLPILPSWTIWSSSPTSDGAASVLTAAGAAWVLGILLSFRPYFRLQSLHLLFVAERGLQNLFQFVVALETASQIGELGAQLQHVPQGLHLAGDLIG